MFDFIKLKNRQKELELIKESIIKEKEELEAIKILLEDKTKKIDISNMYVFSYGGISYIITLELNDNDLFMLRDIFNKQVLFKIFRSEMGNGHEVYMGLNKRYNGEDFYGTLVPIIEKTPDFLIYTNRQVPIYVLQQYLYKLNNLDVRNYVKCK